MTAITLTYCAFCDFCAKVFTGMIKSCEAIGNARAAHELTRMGLHKEARQLMTGRKDD
jgi:hypothetical protein